MFGQPVTAVPDGLKAWETLKESARMIDLILTEMELPSISGFALLSLAREHEICKNIPVISMLSVEVVSSSKLWFSKLDVSETNIIHILLL